MGSLLSRNAKKDPKSEIWIAKEDVTLWSFNHGKVNKAFHKKGEEFILKRKAKETAYEEKSHYWLFQSNTALGAQGYACRFYFYPQHYSIPEEPFPWYFGTIERSESQELLAHEQNGDGAYLIRWSNKKKAFVLSIKYLCHFTNDWATTHYNVMRTNVDKGQYYFEPTKMFHQLQDLLEKYKEEEQQRFPTHLTNICFVPNPLADPTFAADQQLQADENLWLINRDELHIDKELGRGNFGVVSLGRWRNETKVAIKELIAMDTAEGYSNDADKYDKEKKNFEAEMEIMKKLNHPNLVKMYGICVDKLPFFIIQELCEKGDLKKHLETFKEGIGRIIEGKRNVPKFDQLIKWSHDIALGMSYLEKKEIVHRDLAARNVLLSKYSRAKVADFGLSQDKGHEEDNVAFPILWSPLEVLISRSFSTKSDVWSFGITVWEVFSFGDKPYGGMKRADLKYFLKSGNRIEPPNIYTKDEGDGERTNNVYNDILLKCWAKAPEDRPTFQMLCKELSIYINQNNIY